jgi:hypothetical protein
LVMVVVFEYGGGGIREPVWSFWESCANVPNTSWKF